MKKNLSLWIAQSESWHTFIDFSLPEEAIAKYPFLRRADDFYIALFCKFFDLLNDTDLTKKKGDLLAIGKGLEIYSLKNTKNKFGGVNDYENILYAASLYYLADFSASAWLLANLYSADQYASDVDKFISCFLNRHLNQDTTYVSRLREYLESGAISILDELRKTFALKTEETLLNSPQAYTSYKLAFHLIERFYGNNLWNDLLEQDHHTQEDWGKYVRANLKRRPPIWDFFPSQREALKRGILKENKSFSFQMPTSAGKTALCELIIYNEKIKNPSAKILFLAPFRALASELKAGFSKKLGQLGIKSKAIYGGNIATQDERNAIQKVDLLISTPEKFMAIETFIPDICQSFQLIICDEGHLLDNEQRGLNYELLLSKLRGSGVSDKKFIFLSAIIPNLKDVNDWLGGDDTSLIKSDYRPTELNFAFLRRSRDSFILDVNPLKAMPENYLLNNFLTSSDFQYVNPLTKRMNKYPHNTEKSIAVAVALKSVPSGTVALFTPQKGKLGVSGLAEELIEQVNTLSLPNPSNYSDEARVTNLKEYFAKLFGEEYLLTRLIDCGATFHHGDLPQDVREAVEDSLRDGTVPLVICTNTLAEGVNLPIKTMVIHSAKRYDNALQRRVDMDIRDLKNITGRAGRAGKETKGLIITTNPNDFELFKMLMKDKGSRNITGFLYRIVLAVAKFIRENRQPLTNEIFSKQDERFKQHIDAIDISLISLMAEEIEPEKLKEHIKSLVEQTFAFQQASDEEKEALRDIFSLRGDALIPYVEAREYSAIKKSGAPLRLYSDLLDSINFEDDLWISTDAPLSKKWLALIKNTVFSLPQLKFSMEEFNKYNKTDLLPDDIIEIIRRWIEGRTYKDISDNAQIAVDTVLKLFSSIIGFQLHNIISSIIRMADSKLLELDKHLSETLIRWPQYLLYGLRSSVELDLIELGFTNRLGIIALSAAIQDETFSYSEIKQLRRFIKKNSDRLLGRINREIPAIAYEKIKENLEYLHGRNIY